MSGYLPKESTDSKINKTILRTLWNNRLISKALDVKNENEARLWFNKHPEANKKFDEWNKEFKHKMKELQRKASDYLSSFKETRGIKRPNKSKNAKKIKKNKQQ